MPITVRPRLPLQVLVLAAALATAPVGGAEPLPVSREQIGTMGLAFARAEPADWVPVARIPARVELAPDSRSLVAARHEGSVQRTLVVEGEAVVAGQPLLAVASAPWAEALAAATGRAARLAALERQARRSEGLLAAGVIASKDDEAVRAELAGLRAEVRADGEAARAATLDAAGAVVLAAPAAGRIVHRQAPGTSFAAGAMLVELASGDALVAQGHAPARLAGRLEAGMEATTPDGMVGEVVGVSPAIDPETRSLAVAVRLPAGAAAPGALLELDLRRRAEAATVRVPAAAVIEVAGRSTVFVRGDGGIEAAPVDLRHRDGRDAWVGGLAGGAEVVTRGVLALKAVAEGAAEPAGAH